MRSSFIFMNCDSSTPHSHRRIRAQTVEITRPSDTHVPRHPRPGGVGRDRRGRRPAQLLEMGPSGSSADHDANPSSLHDVFFRVGGAAVGKATTSLTINSDDVTMYGLFVEHYQKHQTIWNGNGGRTYFYQNEMPYDPPNQAAWMNGSTQGYAAYKVANSVTSHQVYGFGSYCYFHVNPGVTAEHAIEVPNNANVRFRSMVTVSLGGTGTIRHVINDRDGPSNSATNVANLVSHP